MLLEPNSPSPRSIAFVYADELEVTPTLTLLTWSNTSEHCDPVYSSCSLHLLTISWPSQKASSSMTSFLRGHFHHSAEGVVVIHIISTFFDRVNDLRLPATTKNVVKY
jgi:hypothetical protein